MNPNIISIVPTFILDNITGPVVNVKDTTDYVGNGITNSQVKGNVVAKYGSTIFHGDPNNLNWTAPDITRSTSDNISFFLPLDSLMKVINAAYVFLYYVKVAADKLLNPNGFDYWLIDPPPVASPFTSIQIDTGAESQLAIDKIIADLVDTNITNINIHFYAGASLLGSTTLTSCTSGGLLAFPSITIGGFAGISLIKLTGDTVNYKEFDYSFCNKTPKAVLDVTSDCLRSQLTAKDVTNYPANLSEPATRLLTVNYPRYSNSTPVSAPVSTTGAAITIGPDIFTGNYYITLSTLIKYTQDDGLKVRDTITGYVNQNISCSTSICGLASCISSLRTKWQEAVNSGSAQSAILFQQNFRVLLYMNDYNISITCRNTENATRIANELATFLRQEAGCNCGCGEDQTQQGEPKIIYATVTSSLTSNLLSWN